VLARAFPGPSLALGGFAGAGGLILLAASGHAAAYREPAPLVAMIVHLLAVSLWLAGLLTLAWAATLGRRSLRQMVPRFSALALVAVGLLAVTGLYSDWLQTRDLLAFDSPYGLTLGVKIALATAAFALGAVNLRSAGADRGFSRRVVVEAALAAGVLIATGVLASGSPPAQERPIAIAAAPSSAVSAGVPPRLELAPGRPGPTRFSVVVPEAVGHVLVELQLHRLDEAGETRLELTPVPDRVDTYAAGGGLLPADSSWDASVVVRAHDGAELSRTRFSFALDSEGVSSGRSVPPLDPVVLLAALLLLGGLAAGAFVLAGGAVPGVDRAVGRVASLAGSAISVALGLVLVLGGPRL
jgi:hypothetical protein